MKSSRSKSSGKPVSNGPEVPAFLFTKVGMILAMGDYTTTFGLEFPEPISQQEMFAYMDKTVPAQLTILGFVAFTTDNLGVINIMDDLCDADAKITLDRLEETFMPGTHVAVDVNKSGEPEGRIN